MAIRLNLCNGEVVADKFINKNINYSKIYQYQHSPTRRMTAVLLISSSRCQLKRAKCNQVLSIARDVIRITLFDFL